MQPVPLRFSAANDWTPVSSVIQPRPAVSFSTPLR